MADKPSKLPTDSYKGVRDFFPEDMAVQEHIFGVWKKTSESFGYEEYGASVLEPAELYKAKSGEEIVNEQTYTFIDRGDREITLRPEMTPTVARMIADRRRELALPLRWYSIPNLFRYEQPQRGRVREHWQLNADLFGIDSIEADVEIISLAYQIMKNFGAKDEDFEIRINDRQAKMKGLKDKQVLPEQSRMFLKLQDKKEKIPEETYREGIKKIFGEALDISFEESENTKIVLKSLEKWGIKNARFSDTIVRGFDYYTGIVFEIFDTNPENRRSLFGGGRYNDLTSLFSGDKVPAVGFGMGDVTIRDFLRTHKLLPRFESTTKLHICTHESKYIPDAEKVATNLRVRGIPVSVNLTNKKVGDQVSWANKHKIPFIIVIGEEEVKSGKYRLKDLFENMETLTEEAEIADKLGR